MRKAPYCQSNVVMAAVLGLLAGVVLMGTLTSWYQDSRVGGQSTSSDSMEPSSFLSTLTPNTEILPKQSPMATDSSTMRSRDQMGALTHAHTNAGIEAVSSPRRINFMHEPDAFVEIIESCEKSDDCKLIFHHTFKTGGTTIEKSMSNIWQQQHNNSCCDEQRMRKFFQFRDFFCSQKFSSHQVNASAFFDAVHECIYNYPAEQSLRTPRLVLLTSFREPIQMTVSQIHQMCNRHPDRRSPRVLAACQACTYENFTDVWDEMIQDVTNQLQASWHVSRLRIPSGTNSSSDAPPDDSLVAIPTRQVSLPQDTIMLTLETDDITAFFTKYKPKFKLKQRNQALHDTCNFRPTSAMTQKLYRAQAIYRQLVANVDYSYWPL